MKFCITDKAPGTFLGDNIHSYVVRRDYVDFIIKLDDEFFFVESINPVDEGTAMLTTYWGEALLFMNDLSPKDLRKAFPVLADLKEGKIPGMMTIDDEEGPVGIAKVVENTGDEDSFQGLFTSETAAEAFSFGKFCVDLYSSLVQNLPEELRVKLLSQTGSSRR